MPTRNPEILRIFEIADDALQGLLGYFHFTSAAVGWAADNGILQSLPEKAFQITPEWRRFYRKFELLVFMRNTFHIVNSRQCMIAMVSYIDAETGDFVDI